MLKVCFRMFKMSQFFRTLAKLNLDLDDHFGSGDIDYENYTTTAVRPDTGEVFFSLKVSNPPIIIFF